MTDTEYEIRMHYDCLNHPEIRTLQVDSSLRCRDFSCAHVTSNTNEMCVEDVVDCRDAEVKVYHIQLRKYRFRLGKTVYMGQCPRCLSIYYQEG